MIENDVAVQLYVDLLKRALTNWNHGHEEFAPVDFTAVGKLLQRWMCPEGAMLVRHQPFDADKRQNGQDWPAPFFAHTMIGMKRLDNLQQCVESVLRDKVPGDFIETGVWRGGGSIFMRGLLKVYGDVERRVWVADSFQGLPQPNVEDYPEDAGDVHFAIDDLKVSMEQVRRNFEAYGLFDDQVKFLKGWFSETLPIAPIEQLAVLRLDGDMYESTIVALDSLYHKLSIGGYVIVDDYCIPSCRKAVDDFRSRLQIIDEVCHIDGTGVFWRRSV